MELFDGWTAIQYLIETIVILGFVGFPTLIFFLELFFKGVRHDIHG